MSTLPYFLRQRRRKGPIFQGSCQECSGPNNFIEILNLERPNMKGHVDPYMANGKANGHHLYKQRVPNFQ